MRGVEGMVLVNGVPVQGWICAGEEARVEIGDISTWLRAGRNRLTALIRPSPVASSRSVNLVVEGPNQRPLAVLESTDRRGFQHASFELPRAASSSVWRTARPLSAGRELDDEAFAVYRRAVSCILADDIEGLVELRYDSGPFRSVVVLRELLRSATLLPAPVDALRTDLGGDGRILTVWRRPRGAPLTFVDDAGRPVFSMCFHLARIQGVLRWIR